ncbi:27740_t:CDS:2 [Gigaspora margarita]|uniref:27740_t:CDS:1 n=1 Tax=Gigaspora margarita TaxID=4874 RepID=A0ABN7UVU6_GIGMA|nr:27740_t:CDS:2 [Gigaspora margarita]
MSTILEILEVNFEYYSDDYTNEIVESSGTSSETFLATTATSIIS